jgi:hypothetical protein
MTEARAKELIWMNRVLATLVVLLSLAAGLMLAQKHEWISNNKAGGVTQQIVK